MSRADKQRCAQFKPFNGANSSCDLKIFHGLPLYNPFTDNDDHVNFSPWHTNFVARCNIARLSNDMRKYALHCMTAGRAQEYVTHVHNRRYSYIYKHLIQQYGDGSAHVGYQEQFDTVVQHDDERIEEYGARWRTAFKRRFGKRFKLDTTKNMSDLIRFVANDYVKSQLAALKLHKFDDVMRHGRRLEKEAATYGFSSKFGPPVNTPISLPSDYSKRRVLSTMYAAERPQTVTNKVSSRPRWRNWRTPFTQKQSTSANISNTAAINPSEAMTDVVKQLQQLTLDQHLEEEAHASDDDVQFSECDDDEAQFICCIEKTMAEIFEVASKPNTEQVLREQLRNDVSHLSVRMNALEQQFRQRQKDISAVTGLVNSSIVTGKCWNCGQPGHSWRRCPTRKPDDKSALPFRPPGTDDRLTQMRTYRKSEVGKSPAQPNKFVSTIEISRTTICSAATWSSLQIAATLRDRIQQTATHTVSSSDLHINSIDEISEDDPLMTLPRLFTLGIINTISFPCLIDTGAATNLLSLLIYNSLPEQPQLTCATTEFNTAAGTQLDVVGRALCNIQIADKITATPFYIVRNLVGAALLGMPYLTQAGVIIHVATHEIDFADDERTPILTTTAPDLPNVSTISPTRYDCAVNTVHSITSQPDQSQVILTNSVTIEPNTAQVVVASIPPNTLLAGYLEPAENVQQDSGLFIAHVHIPEDVPVRNTIKLWVLNIHDVAHTLLPGVVAYIHQYDGHKQTPSIISTIEPSSSSSPTRTVQTQTDQDPRFPCEYLHVPVPESELPPHARYLIGEPDHPDASPVRQQLRRVPWTNTMLYPPPKLPRTEEDLQKIYDAIKLDETDLTSEQQLRMKKMFANWYYRRLIAVQPDDLGRCGLVRVRYDLLPGEKGPIRVPPRRIPPERLAGAYETCDKWLRTNTIQPSTSPFTFPPVFVPKPHTNNTKWRMCVDYRQLNDKSVKYALPLPRCDEVVASVGGAKYFTTLDLQWGFLQMENEPETAPYTAFTVPGRHYHFNVLPFGVTNGPGVFQRLMSLVLDGLLGIYALNYIDDILITGKTFDEICLNMNIVFDRLEQANLMVGFEKVFPCRRSRVFLGFLLDENGIRPDPEKIKSFQTMTPPTTYYQVRQLVGFLNFNTMMVPRLSIMLQPITKLLQNLPAGAGKKPRPNVPPPACELLGECWSDEQQKAFDDIRTALTNAVAVAYPSSHGLFVLSTDASSFGIGAILQQFQSVPDNPDQQELRTLAFASRPLSKAERNYAATKLELLAVVTFVRRFHQYLIGRRFILLTDHYALQWLFTSMSTSEGIMARWITQLSVYDIAVFYRRGTDNTAADFLSRRTYTEKDLRSLLQDPDLHVSGGHSKLATHEAATQIDSIVLPDENALYEQLSNQIAYIHAVLKANTYEVDTPFGVPTDWKLEQELDQAIQYTLQHLKSSQPPVDLNDQPDATKRLWSAHQQFVFEQGLLYFCPKRPSPEFCGTQQQTRLLVVPQKWRFPLTMFYHATKCMAHAGPYQTYKRLFATYWWPTMQNDVKTILSTCDICQRVKSGPCNMHAPLVPIPTNRVFERVHMDLMGPMANSHGYKYILVIIDAFSRWIEAVPLTNKRAETVAWALLTTWICRYGWMDILHSDNGTEFVNQVMTNLCDWLGIIRTNTTAYHPQGNGMCERANRSLKQALTCLLMEYGTGWYKALPFALWSIRSAIHRVTGYAPYQVLFAQHMRTPYDFARYDEGKSTTSNNLSPTCSNIVLSHSHDNMGQSSLDQTLLTCSAVQHATTQTATSCDDVFEPSTSHQPVVIASIAQKLVAAINDKTTDQSKLYGDYVDDLIKLFSEIHDRVRKSISASVQQTKRQYDRRTFSRHFQPGQPVLIKIPIKPSEEAPGEKFYPHWRGPYTILFAFDDRTSYRIIDTTTNEQWTENINNIKSYKTPSKRTYPTSTSYGTNNVHFVHSVAHVLCPNNGILVRVRGATPMVTRIAYEMFPPYAAYENTRNAHIFDASASAYKSVDAEQCVLFEEGVREHFDFATHENFISKHFAHFEDANTKRTDRKRIKMDDPAISDDDQDPDTSQLHTSTSKLDVNKNDEDVDSEMDVKAEKQYVQTDRDDDDDDIEQEEDQIATT